MFLGAHRDLSLPVDGRALGYRRPSSDPGNWYVRVHVGDRNYKMSALRTADDAVTADGESVLTYAQAVKHASGWQPGIGVRPSEDLTDRWPPRG